MSQHVHSSFHAIPTVVLAMLRQQAMTAERPSQLQLEQLLAQINQNVEYQNAVQARQIPALTVSQVDQIVKRVQQGRFGSDSGENRGDREAKLAQRNENGLIDWVVLQLSESFHDHHEAFKQTGVGLATLDEVMVQFRSDRAIFDLRWHNYPEAVEKLLDTVRDRLTHLHAEAA